MEATQFDVVKLLQIYQKSQATSLLLPGTYEQKLYPTSASKFDMYHFQIRCQKYLATEIKQNYLKCHDNFRCLHHIWPLQNASASHDARNSNCLMCIAFIALVIKSSTLKPSA